MKKRNQKKPKLMEGKDFMKDIDSKSIISDIENIGSKNENNIIGNIVLKLMTSKPFRRKVIIIAVYLGLSALSFQYVVLKFLVNLF